MKRIFKKTVAMVFTLVMLLTCIPFGGIAALTAAAADAALPGYQTGDILEFGAYPQTKVTDSSLIAKLDAQAKNWQSYRYYSGTGEWEDGKMQPSDYMKYADVQYNGRRYRAVTFSKYRPVDTGSVSTSDTATGNTHQDDNGYYVDNVYYFKYEPLRWRVLDADEGLVMSENIIDSQAYNNYVLYFGGYYWGNPDKTYYAADWANSSLRHWLNHDFYNTAFSSAQQSRIKKTHLENKSTYNKSAYDSANTNDNVFLLSFWDALNTSYVFSSSEAADDVNRRAHSTDYAKCQGCGTYTGSDCQTASGEDISDWRLRSPSDSGGARFVLCNGYVYNGYCVGDTDIGIRPALKLAQSSNPEASVPSLTLSNVASSGKIKLTWNSTGAAKYEVYRATSKNGSYKLMKTTTALSYINTSAVAGKTYYYKVRGVNADGTKSAFSAVKYRTCDLARPVVTASNVASSGKVKLTWAAIDGAVKYKVYRSTSKDSTYKLMKTTTSLSYINSSVTAGTKYYYKVKAIAQKSAADSAYSTVKARTAKLARPTVTVSRASSGYPLLKWNRIDGAVSYKVYRATSANGSYTLLKTTTNLSFTNTSAVKGTTYYYKVKAICANADGSSAYSTVQSIKG